MSMGADMKAAADEVRRQAELKAAAVAVVDEYDGMRDQMFLGQKMDRLRAALLALAPEVRPTVVWDIDPRKHFGRVGGKVVATVTEQQDGTWELTTDDGRTWPKFRNPEQARLAFDTVPARVKRWRWAKCAYRNLLDLLIDEVYVGGLTAGSRTVQVHQMVNDLPDRIGEWPDWETAKTKLLAHFGLKAEDEIRDTRAGTGQVAVKKWEWTPCPFGLDLNHDGKIVGGITFNRHRCEIHRVSNNGWKQYIGNLPTLNEAKAHLLRELDLIDEQQFQKIRAGTGDDKAVGQ